MTEHKIDPVQEQEGRSAPSSRAPQREKAAPVRRVGSITLGIVLVMTGALFLAYYFLPGFDWQLAVRLAPPLALMAMGVEVLFFASRPGQWKYDFLSVFSGLVLMGGCFCLAMLPAVWEELNPQHRYEREMLCRSYEVQIYDALAGVEQEVPLRNMEVYLDQLDALEVTLELYGPYETEAEFAQDCRLLLDAFSELQPRAVSFYWTDRSDPDRGWTGCDLTLSSPVQMDWNADQMTEQVSGYGWKFGDPELPEETEEQELLPEEPLGTEEA